MGIIFVMRFALTKYGWPQLVIFPAIVLAAMAFCLAVGGVYLPSWTVVLVEVILAIILIWVLLFFRDPYRVPPVDERLLLAPADGRVTDIETVEAPAFRNDIGQQTSGNDTGVVRDSIGQQTSGNNTGGVRNSIGQQTSGNDTGVVRNSIGQQTSGNDTGVVLGKQEGGGGPALKIGIFLSIFDAHINRAPCNVMVEKITYKPGRYKNAARSSSAKVNESNELNLRRTDHPRDRLIVRQISGAIARRIVCRARQGQKLSGGEKFGMIKFGSRTELYVAAGENVKILVRVGDKVKAGLTPVIRYEMQDTDIGSTGSL